MNAFPDGVSSRVFLRPIGSPLTLGMAGLGIASLVQSGLDLHWIAKAQTAKVGLILLAAGPPHLPAWPRARRSARAVGRGGRRRRA